MTAVETLPPSPTTVPTPTVHSVCAMVKVTPLVAHDDNRTELHLTLEADRTFSLSQLGIRIYKTNTERDLRVTIQHPDGSNIAGVVIDDSVDSFSIVLDQATVIDAPGIDVVVSYTSTHTEAHGANSSFRVRYVVDNVNCAQSEAFSEQAVTTTPIPGAARVELRLPERADQVIERADLRIEARATAQAPVERVAFKITNDSGAPVWQWSEYAERYCAFGGDALCNTPPPSWWDSLADGTYRVGVTLFVRDGQSVSAEQTFIKRSSASDRSPAATPAATPTATAPTPAESVTRAAYIR